MNFDDIIGGMGGGALAGSALGPWGTAAGAIGGGLLGAYSGYRKGQAQKARNASLERAVSELGAVQKAAWNQRMGDLDKVMGFYGPVTDQYQRLFGQRINLPTFSGTQFGGGK